jgi:protein-S-isoprenylcysteine O-methyltransferase Ste14
MQTASYIVLGLGWFLWGLPYAIAVVRLKSPTAQTVDRRARVGMVLEALGYSLLWQAKFWLVHTPPFRFGLSIFFFLLGIVLSWWAPQTLGRHWRVDAGLNTDHTLVRTGPYRFVRHPIYTSMLCVFFATGLLVTPPLLFLAAFLCFIIGTEIRVRLEDRLLEARFGDEFLSYRRQVSAYVPFVK